MTVDSRWRYRRDAPHWPAAPAPGQGEGSHHIAGDEFHPWLTDDGELMLPLFDCSSSRDGDIREVDIAVLASWARPCHEIDVHFKHTSTFGWHIRVLGRSDLWPVLTLPWHDHVDRYIGDPWRLPYPLTPGEMWSDIDQSREAVVLPVREDIYVADTYWEFDHDRPMPDPVLRAPGHVEIQGEPLALTRVPRAEWDRAWEAAITAVKSGRFEPRQETWPPHPLHADTNKTAADGS